MQIVFRLPAQLSKQLVLYNTEENAYEPLEPPQALDAGQLAMLLPAAVAMQACIALMNLFIQGLAAVLGHVHPSM